MASQVDSDNRGTARLLWDCETVGIALRDRPLAGDRLRARVGDEFAGRLIASLRQGAERAVGESLPSAAEPGRAA